MKMKVIGSALAVLACTILPIIMILAYEHHRTKDLTAEIVARAPEKGNFTPRNLTVPFGRKIKLRVRNTDTVVHGFAIPDLDIDAGSIKAGQVAIVEFTPEKPGTYQFYCTEWCSEHHLQMRGTIEVVKR